MDSITAWILQKLQTLTDAEVASSPTNILTTTGDLLYASAANTLHRLGIGSTAQRLVVASGVPSWVTPAENSGTGGNPTGTSAGPVMMGLGSGCTVTPAFSGRVLVTWNGQAQTNANGNGAVIGPRHGNGTAPANGVAQTGTADAAAVTLITSTASTSGGTGFAFAAIVTGLTVGTAYWFDLSLTNDGGTSCSLSNITFCVAEI